MTETKKTETKRERRLRRTKLAFTWLWDIGKAVASVVQRRRG